MDDPATEKSTDNTSGIVFVYEEITEIVELSEAYTEVPSNAPALIMTIPDEDDYEEEYSGDDDKVTLAQTVQIESSTTAVPSPFGIVLVNIKKAAEDQCIQCETRYLDDQTAAAAPHYIALSYRWGELDEQLVAVTEDYHARIVSFRLQDFFKLCQALHHEPTMQHINYVWVDAICVDQVNIENRKATIYRMSDIYSQADVIVAVPDLHAYHLSSTTSANKQTMAIIENYRDYLYYLLVGTPEAHQTLIDMDHRWMDSLGIPRERQNVIIAATQQQQQQQNQHTISFMQQMEKWMGQENLQIADADNSDSDPNQQKISYRAVMEACQHIEWQQQLVQRQTAIVDGMAFLQSIMEDWSDRTWVISEYHIAKRTKGKMKFWFNQLSSLALHGQRFFEFDFKQRQGTNKSVYETVLVSRNGSHIEREQEPKDPVSLLREQYPYTGNTVYLTLRFKTSMQRRLTRRTLLEMMLQTRASKNDDRFHAIIPLKQKYRHHLKDKHSISRLGISDMLSVRLALLEWLDINDRLNLLFCAATYSSCCSIKTALLLPTFATQLKAIKPGLLKLISQHAYVNFDRNDDDDNNKVLQLIRRQHSQDNNNDNDKDVLWLRPRVYFIRCTQRAPPRNFYDEIGATSGSKLWETVGLDPAMDTLDAVSIPLFVEPREASGDWDDNDDDNNDNYSDDENNDDDNCSHLRSNIQLVGSWKKNVWIVYRFCSHYKRDKIYPSRVRSMDEHPEGFRIY